MANISNKQAFIQAVIALFKSVPFIKGEVSEYDEVEMMEHGLYIDPQAKSALPQIGEYADFIIKAHGYDLAKMNNGLHKSFDKAKAALPMQLFVEQSLHYMSVYLQNGLDDKSAEKVDSSLVYIPAEQVSLEGDPVRVTVIRALTDEEIVKRAKSLLSGMALSESAQIQLMAIVRELMPFFSLDDVRNKEFRIRLMDQLGFMPKKAGEFVRYIVFKKTGLPMVVHSHRSVAAVAANKKGFNSTSAFKAFVAQNGVEAIAREFNRHRNFWIIFKKDGKEVAAIINKARRLSETMNKPAKIGVLDRIGDSSVSLEEVQKELENVTLWKKVSLANSLLRRSGNPSAELYTVRTGRSFSKKNDGEKPVFLTRERLAILNAVIKSIEDEVRPQVEGKKILLPENMDYAFPTSEKQFVGCIPFYSTLSLPNSAIVGIHWENLNDERVDLDLHYVSPKAHVGWNEPFDSKARKSVYHSGDLVDAPAKKGGATEAIFVSQDWKDDFASIDVNIYTRNSAPVPYTLFVGEADESKLSKSYLVSSHEFCTNINGLEAEHSELMLGFVESSEDGKKLHFFNSAIGTDIVSGYSEHNKNALEAVKSVLATRLSLKDILERTGAVFEKGEDEEWDIDLSLGALTKDSFAFLTPPKEKEKVFTDSKSGESPLL